MYTIIEISLKYCSYFLLYAVTFWLILVSISENKRMKKVTYCFFSIEPFCVVIFHMKIALKEQLNWEVLWTFQAAAVSAIPPFFSEYYTELDGSVIKEKQGLWVHYSVPLCLLLPSSAFFFLLFFFNLPETVRLCYLQSMLLRHSLVSTWEWVMAAIFPVPECI